MSAPDENGWMPIESAPIVPGRKLGWVDGTVRFIYYGKTSHVPIYGWNTCDEGAEDCELCEPTHWQPLPKPPVRP